MLKEIKQPQDYYEVAPYLNMSGLPKQDYNDLCAFDDLMWHVRGALSHWLRTRRFRKYVQSNIQLINKNIQSGVITELGGL